MIGTVLYVTSNVFFDKMVQGLFNKLIYLYFRDRIGNSKRNYRNGPEKLQHKRMIEKTS